MASSIRREGSRPGETREVASAPTHARTRAKMVAAAAAELLEHDGAREGTKCAVGLGAAALAR